MSRESRLASSITGATGPAEEQGDGRNDEAQRGEQPEQAEEAHAEAPTSHLPESRAVL